MNATVTRTDTHLVDLGDGLAGLRSLTPGSVGLVLSDLPSGEMMERVT